MSYTILTRMHQLESVLTEAETQGCRDVLEGIWVTDTSNLLECIQFFEDQINNSKYSKLSHKPSILYVCMFSNGREEDEKSMEYGDFSYW